MYLYRIKHHIVKEHNPTSTNWYFENLKKRNILVFDDFSHPDDPLVATSHALILIKKIVAIFSSVRLKHHCKLVRQTVLDKNVRKKTVKIDII